MLWRGCVLGFLLLFGNAYGDASKNRVKRQNYPAANGQVIDSIFNIPITAIRQTATAAQSFSPSNTQNIDNVSKISVSTLEAVGTLVKSIMEQRQQNSGNIQDLRETRKSIKEQQRIRREEIQKQRLEYQLKKNRHHHRDPLGLNALSDLLIGGHHGILGGHHSSGFYGHRPGLGGIHGHHGHGSHGSHGILGSHGGHGNRPQNSYAVHEDSNDDTSFSWHGLTAGFGNFFGTRPSNSAIRIENKVAPKEKRQKILKYSKDDVNIENKLTKINKLRHEHDDPPLENKIAPRSGKVTFV